MGEGVRERANGEWEIIYISKADKLYKWNISNVIEWFVAASIANINFNFPSSF